MCSTSRSFPEIIREPGPDDPRCDVVGFLAREQQYRELRVCLSDRLDEFDPVHLGHIVIADNAVERFLVRPDPSEGDGWRCRRPNATLRPNVVAFEVQPYKITECRIVIHMENRKRPVPCRHLDASRLEKLITLLG